MGVEFSSKIAIVTGTTGIGKHLGAAASLAESYRPPAAGIDPAANAALAADAKTEGLPIEVHTVDVSEPGEVQEAVTAACWRESGSSEAPT